MGTVEELYELSGMIKVGIDLGVVVTRKLLSEQKYGSQ